MKTKLGLLCLLTVATCSTVHAQGTAFTYQGRLNDGSIAATGTYDLQFALFDAASGGTQQSGTWTQLAQGVTNGLFTVTLDFGGFFPGADRWLEIGVRTNGGVAFTTLAPRQKFTATPYAITAGSLSGNITTAQLPVSVVTNGASGVTLTGSFTGNGANVTNVNAATLNGLTSANFWRTTGNAGTIPGTHFLGTTDNQALEFKANGSRILRLAPDLTSPNLIAGSPANDTVGGIRGASVLGGGNASYPNRVAADYATVIGGISNTASGNAAVAMGQFNTASGYAAVASGYGSSAAGFTSFAAGTSARAAHDGSFVWGDNTFADFASSANNQFLVRASGGVGINTTNPAGAALFVNGSIIGGYSGNIISNGVLGGFIGGGGSDFSRNVVGGNFGSVVGGRGNNAAGELSTVSGGYFNSVLGVASTIGGGSVNGIEADAVAGAICGGSQNFIRFNPIGAFIGGGTNNVVHSSLATIAGGGANVIETNADLSAIAGGLGHVIKGPYSVIGGGYFNRAGNVTNSSWNGYAAVGGGGQNTALGPFSTIGGGYRNLASGHGAAVGGGGVLSIEQSGTLVSFGNVARGTGATIPGGAANVADGDFSLAAGLYAGALHARTFVWSSSAVGSGQFESTGPGQFLINATGGVGIGTPNPQAPLHVYSANNPTVLRLQSTGTPGFGRLEFLSNPQGDFNEWRPSYIESSDAGGFTGGLRFVVNGTGAGNKYAELETMRIQNGRVGIGTTAPGQLLQVGNATCNGSLWNNASDRNLKENFKAVDAQAVLEKVVALPLSEWSYKATPGESHVGPMAQDFKAAFGLGADDKSIATVDADGVALAAIQGLNEKVESENAALRAENRALKARLDRLERLIERTASAN